MIDPQAVSADPVAAAAAHATGRHDGLIDPGCPCCAEDGRLWLVDGRVYLPVLVPCATRCGEWLGQLEAWAGFAWPDGRRCFPLCQGCLYEHAFPTPPDDATDGVVAHSGA